MSLQDILHYNLDILHLDLVLIATDWLPLSTSSSVQHGTNSKLLLSFVCAFQQESPLHKRQLMIKPNHISWKNVDTHTDFQVVLTSSTDTVLVSLWKRVGCGSTFGEMTEEEGFTMRNLTNHQGCFGFIRSCRSETCTRLLERISCCTECRTEIMMAKQK